MDGTLNLSLEVYVAALPLARNKRADFFWKAFQQRVLIFHNFRDFSRASRECCDLEDQSSQNVSGIMQSWQPNSGETRKIFGDICNNNNNNIFNERSEGANNTRNYVIKITKL